MIGLPKTFNTKDDYINIVSIIKKAKADPTEMVKKLQSLLSTRNVWVGKGEVDQFYVSKSGEKIMSQEEGEGNEKVTKYSLFKLEADPNSAFLRLEFTEEEVNQLINDLEAA